MSIDELEALVVKRKKLLDTLSFLNGQTKEIERTWQIRFYQDNTSRYSSCGPGKPDESYSFCIDNRDFYANILKKIKEASMEAFREEIAQKESELTHLNNIIEQAEVLLSKLDKGTA